MVDRRLIIAQASRHRAEAIDREIARQRECPSSVIRRAEARISVNPLVAHSRAGCQVEQPSPPIRTAPEINSRAGGAEEIRRAGSRCHERDRADFSGHLQRALGIVQSELTGLRGIARIGVPNSEHVEIEPRRSEAIPAENINLLPRIGSGKADIREEGADLDAAHVRKLKVGNLVGRARARLTDAAEQVIGCHRAGSGEGEAGFTKANLRLDRDGREQGGAKSK